MILRAKYLITGDGRTCLQDQAVYLDKEGKIGWIGDAAEAAGRYPEEMVKDYGEATILPGLFDMHVHSATTTASRIWIIMTIIWWHTMRWSRRNSRCGSVSRRCAICPARPI